MSEEQFKEEVKFPDDLETLLSMSVHYDTLQSLIRFILDILKRHEEGLRITISKQNAIAPEVHTLNSFRENAELKLLGIEKALGKTNLKLEDVKDDLNNRGDTVETLKFLLNMATDHDSHIIQYKKQIQDLQQSKLATDLKINAIENTLKLSKHTKKIKSNPEHKESLEYTTDKDHIYAKNTDLNISESKSDVFSQTSYKPPNKNHKKTHNEAIGSLTDRQNLKEKASEIDSPEKDKHNSSISPVRPSFDPIFQDSISKTSQDLSNKLSPPQNQSKQNTLTSTEPALELISLNTATQIKELMLRIENIEKGLENPPENELKKRINKLESMHKFIESILDSCEPLTLRNRDEILKIVRNLKSLESDMINKLNAQDFDAIKSLVITLASGSPKYDSSVLFPSREINAIRTLEKKINQIEVTMSDLVKIYPENIEEFFLKLRRIEQKLELKADQVQVNESIKSLHDLIEKYKISALNTKEKEKNTSSQLKPSDTAMFASINRRISGVEEIIRSLKIPYGMDLTNLLDEVKRLWKEYKNFLASFEDFKRSETSALNDLRVRLDHKIDPEALKNTEEKFRKQYHDIVEKLSNQFADKSDVKRGMKYLESIINKIENSKFKPEGDDAMIAKKPLGGWSCASCDKKLDSLTGRLGNHSPWGKLPLRDTSERLLKAGPGFSKMLASLQLEGLRSKGDTQEITLPSVRKTDRSVTPSPNPLSQS